MYTFEKFCTFKKRKRVVYITCIRLCICYTYNFFSSSPTSFSLHSIPSPSSFFFSYCFYIILKAQEDLLYGYGSPFDPPNPKFKSNVVSHLLQEAFELVPVIGRFRKFPETFSGCTLVQTLWPE